MNATGTLEEDRAFLQDRLALFTKTMFGLIGILYASALVSVPTIGRALPERAWMAAVISSASMLVVGAVWFLTRRRRLAAVHLRLLDGTLVAGAGLVIGATTGLVAELPSHVFVPYTAGILFLFARVFVIPSTARRTAWLSALCIAPQTAGNIAAVAKDPDSLGLPFSSFVAGAFVLGAALVFLAAFGSHTIYGLRREIREARRFGQYTLDCKLGEGGMGVVFKAHHALLRRPTAIKLLPPDKASPQDIARFEREVQLTSELTHPNTISIFDYGRSADGVFYYVMEYLDGIDLESLVARRGPLPAARAVRILAQICEALDEAHARGIIHRDIKPANVILCRRGRVPDFVKVVDFGLVKEVAKDAGVTAAGTFAGTPAYLAPEAVTDPERVGPAADLYAVGALGYFLITGKAVFEGDSVMAVMAKHLSSVPPPPSSRTDRAIPRDLERILLKCLEKDPSARPGSARTLASELSVLALQGWSVSEAEEWWSRFDSEPRVFDGVALQDTIAVLPHGPKPD